MANTVTDRRMTYSGCSLRYFAPTALSMSSVRSGVHDLKNQRGEVCPQGHLSHAKKWLGISACSSVCPVTTSILAKATDALLKRGGVSYGTVRRYVFQGDLLNVKSRAGLVRVPTARVVFSLS